MKLKLKPAGDKKQRWFPGLILLVTFGSIPLGAQAPTPATALNPSAMPTMPNAPLSSQIPRMPEMEGLIPIQPLVSTQEPLSEDLAIGAEVALPNSLDAVDEIPISQVSIESEESIAEPAAFGIFSFPSLPTGFSGKDGSDFNAFSESTTLLDGLNISANLTSNYNSNIYQGIVAPNSASKDAFMLGFGTTIAYRTQGPEWFFGGTYSGSYNEYIDHSELSGYNQNLGLSAGYNGVFLKTDLSLDISSNNGANRTYDEVTEMVRTVIGFGASYEWSPKSSINGNIGYSQSNSDRPSGDTSDFNLGLFGLWKATPFVQIGPGVRYMLNTGDRQPDRISIGPTLHLNYQAGPKISLNSRFGVDYASYDGGGSPDPSFSTSLGVNYRASEIWGMNLSLVRDVRADPSADNEFNEVTAIRVGYHRKIQRATLNLGCGFEATTSENSSSGAAGDDEEYFIVDASLSMPIFADTTVASIFTSLSDENGDSPNESGSAFQIGFSLRTEL